jgi:multidrug efflux system outer membrane protein
MAPSNRFRHHLAAVLSCIALCGCAGTTRPLALPVTPSAFREGDPRVVDPAAIAQPRADWWTAFSDPTLDRLIERSALGNTNIQQAVARLAQARALAGAADANRMPQVGVTAGASRLGGPLINALGTQGSLASIGASLSYEVDFLGRLSKLSDAAALDAQSRAAALRSVQLMIQADIAQTYFSLRPLDDERALVRATADSLRETLTLVERRRHGGFVTDREVDRLRSEVDTTNAEALALDRQRALLEHRIAFLIGETASTFAIETTTSTAVLPSIPAGIPSEVLQRRPDVAAASSAVQAAQLRLGVAHTAWFPTLSLTANGGYASSELGELLRSSARNWGIAGLLTAAVFDGGRRSAAVASADADLELAAAGYREQILAAFRDVEDQLSSIRLLDQEADALHRAVDAAGRTSARTESLYRNGLISQLDLLDARRSELRDRRTELRTGAARYLATVGLIRALGGGWSSPAPALASLPIDPKRSVR